MHHASFSMASKWLFFGIVVLATNTILVSPAPMNIRVLDRLNNLYSRTNEGDQEAAVVGLINRLKAGYANTFVLTVNKTSFKLKNNMDAFEYYTQANKVHVTATTGVALASGVYHYLKYYCNAHVSWSGDQLDLPEKMPLVRGKLRKVFSDRFRYYQNVCTASYSFAFWDWERWEKEIDWMALNGINLPLAFNGQESIWRMVYGEMGLTEEELDEHFSGAAFLAWQRMGNLDGWGGPLPKSWRNHQLYLQNKILKRMRSFGMTPVLPGFAGHIPPAVVTRLHPKAKYTNSSIWNGFNDAYRTVLLDPMDPLFKTIGAAFIKKQTEVYNGTDHIYNADVFNEMAPPSADPKYIFDLSASLFATMEAEDTQAVWLMQAWQFLSSFWKNDLMKAWFTAVPLGRLILLDLASELIPIYTRTEGYFGHPFIWCMIENFGGNTRLYGASQSVIDGIQTARTNYTNQMVGIGSTPEGINQNHINFELLYEMTLLGNEHVVRMDWMKNYVMRRYNDKYGYVLEGWNSIYKDVYNAIKIHNGGGSQGRVTVTRPYITNKLPVMLWYQPKDLLKAWGVLNTAANTIGTPDTLIHDLAKIGTQFIEDLMPLVYKNLIDAYKNKSLNDLYRNGELLSEMLVDMDLFLSADRYSLLGNWLESAKALGDTEEEKFLMEFNARNQITLWGPDGQIEDYANKNWGGLVKNYYGYRWAVFASELSKCVMGGKPFNNTSFRVTLLDAEKQWNHGHEVYPEQPTGNALEISRMLCQKYTEFYQSNVNLFEDMWRSARMDTSKRAEKGELVLPKHIMRLLK